MKNLIKPKYIPPKVSKLDYANSMLGEDPDCDPFGSSASVGCGDGNNATGWGCAEGNDAQNFIDP